MWAKEWIKKLLCYRSRRKQAAWQDYIRHTVPLARLPFLIVNVVDHCNLGCIGCDHFSPLAKPRFVPKETVAADIARMAEVMDGHIDMLGIMGGEPLLHPELGEIVTLCRAAFPHAAIHVDTNGILLEQQSEAFWRSAREAGAEIVVTRYPIDLDHEALRALAASHGVAFRFFEQSGEVKTRMMKMPLDLSGKQDPVNSFLHCYHVNSCPLLMEGRLYPCTIMPNIRIFNEKFGKALELCSSDSLDIYRPLTEAEVLRFLCTPKYFCRYCKTEERRDGIPWQRSQKKMEEWV